VPPVSVIVEPVIDPQKLEPPLIVIGEFRGVYDRVAVRTSGKHNGTPYIS